ncbi:glutathione S-transferase family protein [Sphingobium vermicomposti]|uniref:Glutathione S-transferase n=1 Tax=Sphingobium vermicomposti TaxID=529005 RepID=A0A846M8Z1_9SPHN|nr:glutathione S-transferase family protein [Sphingobium vermicomposti]NIJ17140.1 glutathione S-transferase [Sphingobium vermicomposti]
MIIYGARPSPFVRKVIIFADEKGLSAEVMPGGFGQGGEAFAKASPFGKIPAFQDGDFLISDSSAIITYMDAVQPDPNLIPLEAKARARTIWYDEFGDTIIQAAGMPIVFNRMVAPLVNMPQDLDAAARAETEKLPTVYDYLESVIPDSGFLVEDRFTLADIAVACPIITVNYCSSVLADGRWPKISAWLQGLSARPSFARALAAEEDALRKMRGN